MSILELTNYAKICMERLSSCRKIEPPRNLPIGDQIAHIMMKCEGLCPNYYACNRIASANDILLDLEEDEN